MHAVAYRLVPPDRSQRGRRGSITVMCAILLTALLVVAGLTINLTQLSTAKTEIRIASDAAAKAGAVVLGQTQSITEARRVAKQVAAKHRVSNEPMKIRNVDVEFGFNEETSDGKYQFHPDEEPYNAVRVHCRMDDGARTGKGTFYIGGPFDNKDFALTYTATATRVDHDVCLVVDRSGSMAWDTSNDEWAYPLDDDDESSIIQNYFLPPHPTDSRWAALRRSADVFFDHLEDVRSDIRVGLVSYSSNFVFGLYESEASTVESELVDEFGALGEALDRIGQKEIIGNTNIASGMQAAVRVLTSDRSRLTAKGTMVVMTDGMWTQGKDPVEVAAAAAEANITVHAITFGNQADQVLMEQVAATGGGNHYYAPDEATLRAIFAEIADTLPTVLSD